ncbi:hypothetical protein AX774_g4483 [Zancudomyces culisetae]|uniref:Uncharacterized protein n=1 Tax=Zancudomyces culisetae TaxID=1213189 RepID=A0A1R1PM88_ZANCU|nr:hypothetical protein AX774_g4483 [Zancudomyces culisetae]|eukprot:OMH82049.1 hypothetical protein AX774_g4483 [Zancudomyces culisetae]
MPEPASRIVLGQFCLGGIDLFGGIEEKIPLDKKADLIDWIYKQQVTLENCGRFNFRLYVSNDESESTFTLH